MSPSIFDLITDGNDGEQVFSGEGVEAALERAIADRPVAGRPIGFDPTGDGGGSPAPTPDGEVHGAEGGAPESPVAGPPESPAAAPPPPPPVPAPVAGETPPVPTDPLLADLTDLERMELTQLRQALRDPERQMGVRRAMLGVEAPAGTPVASPTATAPAPPPAPTLPEEFEPGSAEAQLWQDNQDMRRELAALQQGRVEDQAQTEQQAMMGAAQRATASFSAKYAGRLAPDEIAAIAQHAGMQKLPEAFRPVSSSWDEAMEKSLDYVLRSNDVMLGKVLGGASAPAAGTRTPEADARGRKLTALSSAASPAGDAPTRSPLEHRGDGKLTEKSRLQLVQEMMSGGAMTGSPE